MSALVVTFLSHLDVPNAGALVFKSLQKGMAVVQSLMLEQLHDAENDMHILKASQISVNSAYLAKLPKFLGSALWDVLAGMQFADVAWRGKAAKADGVGLDGLNSSGKVRVCFPHAFFIFFFRISDKKDNSHDLPYLPYTSFI